MYLFYDENGVLKEIINDIPLRQGSDLINRVYVFIDRELPSNVVYSYKYKKPNSEISESIVFETSEKAIIPFNRHRDLQYFKYGKEYNFNYFDIPIDALTNEGMISFNISITDEDFNLSLELLTLNIEEGVVAITESITQSQFVYLMEMIAEYKQLYYNRIDSAESDIEDILDGSKVVDKAKKDQLGNIINTHYATETDLQTNLTKLQDGRIIVKKAEQDQEGNIIDKTYINVVEIDYNNSTNKVILTFSTPFGTITYDEIVLPKASNAKDGLLDKDDKIKLDDLPTESELDSGTYQVGVSKKAINDIDGNAIKDTYIKVSEKGQPNGIPTLNASGRIPNQYIPGSVDDVIEINSEIIYDSDTIMSADFGHASNVRVLYNAKPKIELWFRSVYYQSFEYERDAIQDAIYVAKNNNKTYRLSQLVYQGQGIVVEISKSLAIGETSESAYRGDRGKIAYDHSQEVGNPHATESKDIDYDNTESGLESEKVQSAIDELADKKAEITYVDDELGKKLDKTTFEAYEIDTSETIDKKADYDGYYATLHAGVSDQLASPVPQIDTQEYLFRTSGGTADLGSGIAKIKSLGGRTLVFNQIVKGNFESTNDYRGTATLTVSNNVGTMLATAKNQYIRHAIRVGVVKGRKYLARIEIKNTSSDIKFLIVQNASPYTTFVNLDNSGLGSFEKLASIFTANETVIDDVDIRIRDGRESGWDNVEIKNLMFIDLTLMYGAGNEPSTVAEFEKDFPNAYYDYTLPTIKNISIDAIKTVGFNLYNGEYAKVVKADDNNNGYQINGAYNKVYFNTINELDGNEIELTPISNQVFPSENGYLFLTETDETTCISIVWSGWRVDDTEEYWEEERLIETTDLFPNGMNGIGEIYDEITDTHKIQRFKVVDLGELDWIMQDASLGYFFSNGIGEIKTPQNHQKATIINTAYTLMSFDNLHANIETIQEAIAIQKNGLVRLVDSDFIGFSETQAKQALSGVYMVYELKTPIITPHEKRLQYAVDDFGTEEFILAQQSLQVPIKHKTTYLENLRDKLRRLPSVSEIGSLSELDTDDKTIVGAINEIHTKVVSLDLQGLPPLTKDSVGKKGEWAIDSSYLYICVDTNTWERIAYDDTWGNE